MMKVSFKHHRQNNGFTLLEVVIVLVIVALLLSVIYSIAQGTLTLADDIRRAQRRESRQHAFTGFCEHLLANLTTTTKLNLNTTQEGGQYLTQLELENVPSPFDGSPNRLVTLFTEPVTGGGMRLRLSCRKLADTTPNVNVVLLDDLMQCEWRAYDSATRQWTTVWKTFPHPTLMELSFTQASDNRRQVFWIAPNEAIIQSAPNPPQG
jgi:prepilin-type N-terminal cleavage/methylation domain-containing protein|uniref:prepilin-type N-terminal cleavage/methylation domain-containing protein n=1 Tax=Prosthecobacter sp. TaxID=1965333 RepID=UPI00378489BD